MNDTNILIVEDEAITAMDIRERLKKFGYHVPAITPSGEEAVEMARSIKPNLILMDIYLKGNIDGTVAAQQISRHQHIPIIFLTAYKDEDTFSRAKLSSPYGYIGKPIDSRDLRIAIELTLFKHRMIMQLQSAERRYRALMDNASCGFIVQDIRGVIVETNKKVEWILESRKENIIGKPFADLFIPDERAYVALKLQKAEANGHINYKELHIHSGNGKIKDIDCTSTFIDTGEERLILSIINDVTDRQQMYNKMVLSDKLATVGTLTAGIIHEINNPMTFVATNLHYINDQLKMLNLNDTNQVTQFMLLLDEVINESILGASKIQEIIQELKGFSRIGHDEITPVYIHEILNFAIHMANPQYKLTATIETHYAPNVPLLLLERNKLHQVFLNLIMNAAQAFEASQKKDNLISITTTVKDNHIQIEFMDTGKGISPDIINKIFDPFFTTKPVGIGTGLGLSISQDIINQMGGEITVRSEINQGTTFTIRLLMKVKLESPKDQINISLPTPKTQVRKSILIVDDDPVTLNILERILGKYHEIVTVNSSLEALKILSQKNKFDLVITDIHMPDVSGIDLYKFILNNHPGLERNMIFMSGGVMNETTNDFIIQTKNDLLLKPFTPEQLIHVINAKN